jgi:hypothetical protein
MSRTVAIANENGIYNLLFLPIGNYTLAAEVSGFKKATLGPFKLEVNQTARVDIKMEVGDTSQSVEVQAVAPILQTESTQTGETISAGKLTSLPLNGRNFASLTLLVPGAVTTNPKSLGSSNRLGARPFVNGNREQTNNFMLDGVDVNDSIDNRIGYQPNVDALEEGEDFHRQYRRRLRQRRRQRDHVDAEERDQCVSRQRLRVLAQ